MNFDDLHNKNITPPIKPDVESDHDTRNFEYALRLCVERSMSMPPMHDCALNERLHRRKYPDSTEGGGQCIDDRDQDLFDDF